MTVAVVVAAIHGFDVSRGNQLFTRSDPQNGSIITLLRAGHFDRCQAAPWHGQIEEGILLQHVQEVRKVTACFLMCCANQ
jgi:hypothetical protein